MDRHTQPTQSHTPTIPKQPTIPHPPAPPYTTQQAIDTHAYTAYSEDYTARSRAGLLCYEAERDNIAEDLMQPLSGKALRVLITHVRTEILENTLAVLEYRVIIEDSWTPYAPSTRMQVMFNRIELCKWELKRRRTTPPTHNTLERTSTIEPSSGSLSD
jgi:hypothetical protein